MEPAPARPFSGTSRAGSRDTATDLKELHVSFCRRRCLQPAERDAKYVLWSGNEYLVRCRYVYAFLFGSNPETTEFTFRLFRSRSGVAQPILIFQNHV